jgi:hypothetical protein
MPQVDEQILEVPGCDVLSVGKLKEAGDGEGSQTESSLI